MRAAQDGQVAWVVPEMRVVQGGSVPWVVSELKAVQVESLPAYGSKEGPSCRNQVVAQLK